MTGSWKCRLSLGDHRRAWLHTVRQHEGPSYSAHLASSSLCCSIWISSSTRFMASWPMHWCCKGPCHGVPALAMLPIPCGWPCACTVCTVCCCCAPMDHACCTGPVGMLLLGCMAADGGSMARSCVFSLRSLHGSRQQHAGSKVHVFNKGQYQRVEDTHISTSCCRACFSARSCLSASCNLSIPICST